MKLRVNTQKLENDFNEALGRFAFLIHGEIVKRVPRRFRNRFFVKQEGKKWIIGTNDLIFKFYEHPTKPHDIKAKNVNFLKFEWGNAPMGLTSSDGFFFFPKVRHPGTKGAFILKSICEDKVLLERLFLQAMR